MIDGRHRALAKICVDSAGILSPKRQHLEYIDNLDNIAASAWVMLFVLSWSIVAADKKQTWARFLAEEYHCLENGH